MPLPLKMTISFDTRVGEYSAKQPLSGEKVVTNIRVKGFNVSSFVRIEETKKAS